MSVLPPRACFHDPLVDLVLGVRSAEMRLHGLLESIASPAEALANEPATPEILLLLGLLSIGRQLRALFPAEPLPRERRARPQPPPGSLLR